MQHDLPPLMLAVARQRVAKVRPSSFRAACGTRSSIDAMADWFARPVLHVASVEASLRFYVDRLGFTVAWQFEEDGRVFVAQVDRGSCALKFSDQWPEKVGKG